MNRIRQIAVSSILVGSMAAAGVAAAQSKSVCNTFQSNSDAFGDRDGHSVSVSEYACTVTGGLLDGGVTKGIGYWDVSGGTFAMLSGNGVVRKPGALAVFQQLEGKLNLVMKDGKPVGWNGAGRARYVAASGSMSPLHGKAFRWQAASTGFNTFTIESTLE
jgi:hypothetical protein